MIWQARHDTRRRLWLRGADEHNKGLVGKDGPKRLRRLWPADVALRGTFRTFAWAIGLERYPLPDMAEIAELAREYYDLELRGGEGHMEVGKLIQAVSHNKAHMVVSVKPFGCMPSSGVSDGIQSLVLSKFPEAVFCPVETTGDGAANFQSRILMFLFRARRKAAAELESALSRRGLTLHEARAKIRGRRGKATFYPAHVAAVTAASLVHGL